MKKWQKILTVFFIFNLIPLGVGLGLGFGLHDFKYIEGLFAGFALIALLIVIIRINLLDRKIYKKEVRKSEFKRTEEYSDYVYLQVLFLIACVLDVIASLIVFFVSIK